MDVSSWLRKQLEETSPDLLRVMVKDFAEALMSADAGAVCGAGYGERSPERLNRRNGYRERERRRISVCRRTSTTSKRASPSARVCSTTYGPVFPSRRLRVTFSPI